MSDVPSISDEEWVKTVETAMTNELVERLCLDIDSKMHDPVDYYEKERLEAAAEIERLNQEIERLRDEIAYIHHDGETP
jgi:hypothetical protein